MTGVDDSEAKIAEIQKILSLRETSYLIKVWEDQDRKEWTPETFEAIKRILLERLGTLPETNLWHPLIDKIDEPQRAERALQILAEAEEWLDRNRLEQALESTQEALRLAPNLAAAHNLQGLIYDSLDRIDEAIASYHKALHLDSGFTEATENLREAEKERDQARYLPKVKDHLDHAIDFFDDEQPENALTECELAIQESPTYAPAYNYKGMALEEMGNLPDAIDAYQKALELDPGFSPALENVWNARVKWREEQFSLIAHGDFEVIGAEPDYPTVDSIYDKTFHDEFAQNQHVVDGIDLDAPAFYLDQKAVLLRGWPGYRTRPGRSGLDYLDSYFEEAHIEGVLIRCMFTGTLRTHNLFYLALMLLAGLIYLLPGILLVGINDLLSVSGVIALMLFLPSIAVGIALLANVVISVFTRNKEQHGLITGP